ncbi:MAG: hypothetical protein R3A10_10910 [Caldilineaceae bacterium]
MVVPLPAFAAYDLWQARRHIFTSWTRYPFYVPVALGVLARFPPSTPCTTAARWSPATAPSTAGIRCPSLGATRWDRPSSTGTA